MRSVKRGGRSCHAMSALVCGLDVHKDSIYATILNLEGKIVNQTRMENGRVLPYLSHFKVSKVGRSRITIRYSTAPTTSHILWAQQHQTETTLT